LTGYLEAEPLAEGNIAVDVGLEERWLLLLIDRVEENLKQGLPDAATRNSGRTTMGPMCQWGS
jgi:hypothetical protein